MVRCGQPDLRRNQLHLRSQKASPTEAAFIIHQPSHATFTHTLLQESPTATLGTKLLPRDVDSSTDTLQITRPTAHRMADPKAQIMDQVRQQAALQNARLLVEVRLFLFSSNPRALTLIQKLNEHCYTHCVPKPASSLSSGEQTCFTQCMEKYMQAWNVVSRGYTENIRKSSQGGGGGVF